MRFNPTPPDFALNKKMTEGRNVNGQSGSNRKDHPTDVQEDSWLLRLLQTHFLRQLDPKCINSDADSQVIDKLLPGVLLRFAIQSQG